MVAKTKTRPVATFDHLKSGKKPLRRTVTIFLNDETVEAYEEALLNLQDTREDDEGAVSTATARLQEARRALEAESVRLTFQSVGRKKYEKIVQAHPADEKTNEEYKEQFGRDAPYDADAFAVALISASCIEPEMTERQVEELRDDWNTAEYLELFTTALEVNTQRRVVQLGKASG